MTAPRLAPYDAILIVDVQVDFCPGGALPIPDGDAVVPVVNHWIEAAERAGSPIYLSRDWHPDGHPSFRANGGEWPVHCVQDSPGAALHPGVRRPAAARIVTKGTRFDRDQYSAFDETGLGAALRKDGVTRVFVAGLAADVCVRASVLDAIAQGFETHLVLAGTRPVTPEGGRAALDEMRRAGARIVTGE